MIVYIFIKMKHQQQTISQKTYFKPNPPIAIFVEIFLAFLFIIMEFPLISGLFFGMSILDINYAWSYHCERTNIIKDSGDNLK